MQFLSALSLLPIALASVIEDTSLAGPTTHGASLRGPLVVRNAMVKYRSMLPTLVTGAIVNGTVTAMPTEFDATYQINVGIGMPQSTYSMQIDSSTSDFTVYAPKLGTAPANVTTSVNIGGVTIARQAITLSSDTSGGSNLVGMSYAAPSFYTNAVNQGIITPLWTAALNHGATGTYTLGYINPASYSGPITYVNVVSSSGFWQFSSSGYAVGSGAFTSFATAPIVDTGTTIIFLPQALVAAYYKSVSGASYSNTEGGYVFPCTDALPDLTIGIGSYRALVPGAYLNYAPLETGSSTCFGALQPNTNIGLSILGLTFIKSQYVVFKGTTAPSLGFAKKP